jgi:hypothetical protein
VTTVLTELSKLDYPLKKYKVQREDFYTYLTEPGGDEGEDSLG